MKNTEFELKQFNKDLGALVLKQSLNFANVIFADPKVKLSVTASFAPELMGNEYCTLGSELELIYEKDMNSFYYGASPRLDSHKIIEAISQMKLSTLEGINEFIKENANLFMLHRDQDKYLLSFARHLVIAFSSNYGIRLQFSREFDIKRRIIDKYKIKAKESGCCAISDNNDGNIMGCCTILANNDNNILCLHGCPPEDLLKILEEYSFVEKTVKDQRSGEPITVWSHCCGGKSVKNIYSIPGNVILLNGTVLYSGVLFKPLKIEKEASDFENDDIISIVIYFERSTYATVYSLDNKFIEHPLLDYTTRKELNCFFAKDDTEKTNFIQNIGNADKDCIFDVVTTYLSKSYNVNQIGVSGTVITKDSIAVYGQRNDKAIDGGSIYPGVNGNAELFDSDVSFYKKSVYEDVPTVTVRDDRIDFQGEICREAYAELAVSFDTKMCVCRGIVLSGNNPNSSSPACKSTNQSRRMHLNIIFELQCDKSFDELLSSYKIASESFENKDLLGLRIKCYDDFLHYIRQKVYGGFKFIVSSKDFFEALLILIFFCVTMIGRNIETAISLESVASFIVALLVLVVNISEAYTVIMAIGNRNKHIRNAKVHKKQKLAKISYIAEQFLIRYKYHPVTAATTKLYIENTVYNAFRRK